MTMKRCDNGHYYEADKHTTCPACGVSDLDIQTTQKLVSATDGEHFGNAFDNEPKTKPANGVNPSSRRPSDDGVTVVVSKKMLGIDPVVGWLVCSDGVDKGRDYRLHSERNFIGRGASMDVSIQGDDTISRENHAVITFNPKNKKFKLSPGDSRGLVYLNQDDVDMPTELCPYDVIEIGQTKLVFIPFCGDTFNWDN